MPQYLSRVITWALALTLAIGGIGIYSPGGVAAATASAARIECREFPSGTTQPTEPLASYTGIPPTRLVDTRDGLGGAIGPVGEGCTVVLDLDASPVPDDAAAVAFSVTAIGSKPGFLTAFPCAAGRPGTSNLNTRPDGFPTPNLVVVKPDANNEVCVYTLFQAEVILDLSGYWTVEGPDRFTPISPTRAIDTRLVGLGERVLGGSVLPVDVSSIVPDDATAVVANLTVTDAIGNGYIGAFPCSPNPPMASNLNFYAFESRAVAAIVGLGDNGQLCLNSPVDAHMVVDITGYYAPAPEWGPSESYIPLPSTRLADSRDLNGIWATPFAAGETRHLAATTNIAEADQTTAVVLNVIATQAMGPGYLTVYPCGESVPTASNLNYTAGVEATNIVTVGVSTEQEICVYAHAPVDVVVDRVGAFAVDPGSTARRLMFGNETWPNFSSNNTDYATYCGDKPTTLELTASLISGTTASVNGQSVTSVHTPVAVEPNTLTHVALNRNGEQQDYYFRCLPDKFPKLTVELADGYEPKPAFYATTIFDGEVDWLVILNEYGAPVWYKHPPFGTVDFFRRPDGKLTFASAQDRFGYLPDRGFYVIDLEGNLIDIERTVPNPAKPEVVFPTDHHEYQALPDGTRRMLSYPLLRDQDLTVLQENFAGRFTTPSGKPAIYYSDDTIVDGVIQEIASDDTLLWEWRASDHFSYSEVAFPDGRNHQSAYSSEPHGGEVDPWHINAFQQLSDGDYIVTARHLDAVFRVDRATGKVLWTLDSLPNGIPNKDGATRLRYINDPLGGPKRPHHGRLEGDILTLFDNRARTNEPARAVAYRIDERAGTATLLWQIDEPYGRWSGGLGNTQVLDDDGVLVGWGGALQPMFQEFDADHKLRLTIAQYPAADGDTYGTSVGGITYRIYKYDESSFDIGRLRSTSGGEAETK